MERPGAEALLALVVASNGGELHANTLPLLARNVPRVYVTQDPMRRALIVSTDRKMAPPPAAVSWRLAFREGRTKE